MLDFALTARRGSFRLDLSARFSAPWTVLFGHSGSGKTTLLRLFAGLDRPEDGHIAFRNVPLTDIAARVHLGPGKRGNALVTQQPALFPHMCVESNVRYGIRDRNAAESGRRVQEALELVGAGDLIARRPSELSGGEAQRVALARALAIRPSLLLLDEPFSALDGAAADSLLERLQAWVRQNEVQVIMATHDAPDAYSLGAEVALLQEGKLAALGPAEQVLSAERHRILSRLDTNQAPHNPPGATEPRCKSPSGLSANRAQTEGTPKP